MTEKDRDTSHSIPSKKAQPETLPIEVVQLLKIFARIEVRRQARLRAQKG